MAKLFTDSAVDYAGPLYINNIYGKLQTFNARLFYLLVLSLELYT